MGTTISAKKFNEALQRARNIGTYEEQVTVAGCEIVVRNLRPDEYESIIAECRDLEEYAYLHGYQKAHICRALVEVNSVDFREIQFVEDEAENGRKSVKLELHAWLRKNVVDTWAKEVVQTVFRKIADVITIAEERAKEGITFHVPEETETDKFRRLVNEIRETESELPEGFADRILEDAGYARKVTIEAAKAAEERLTQLAREQAEREKAEAEQQPPPSPPQPPPQTQQQEPVAQAGPAIAPRVVGFEPISEPSLGVVATKVLQPSAAELMRNRQPLNRQAVEIPLPTPNTTSPRAAQVAAVEADADAAGVLGTMPLQNPPVPRPTPDQIPTLTGSTKRQHDPKEYARILDQPPQGGINPRYRPPQRP